MIVCIFDDWAIDNLPTIPFRAAKLRLFYGIQKFCRYYLYFVS